jgi:hypothetical protein
MHAQKSNKLARLRGSRIDKGVHAWIIATDVAQDLKCGAVLSGGAQATATPLTVAPH